MNKKRVALALAATLGVSTLTVTLGQVGEQALIAHAQSSRLTNEQDEARRKAITIKQLDTTATNLINGDVEVTFNNVNTTDIKTVTATAFEHKRFTERESIDGQNSAVTPTWANGKLTFSGIKEAGIYTGTVTIEYNGGTKETYTLSLTKKATDTIELGKVDVTAGAIKISDVKFNGQALKDGETLYLVEKGGSVTSTTPKATYTAADGAVFNNGIKFEVGKVYEVVYKYANDLHEVSAQVMLVKEAPKFSAYASNGATFEADLQAQVEKDFMVNAGSAVITPGTKPTGTDLGLVNFSVDIAGVGNVVKYDQVYRGASDLGGAALTPSFDSTGALTLQLGAATASTVGTNFVPFIELGYGDDVSTNTGLIGDYTVKVGTGNDISYFNASAHVQNVQADSAGASAILSVGTIATDLSSLDKKEINLTGTETEQVLNLTHGYTSVDVEFKVKDANFAGKSFSDWETEVKNYVTANSPTITDSVLPTTLTSNVTPSNIVSIVVSKDALEDAVVSAEFVKTSDSTGELVLKNGQSLFPSNFNPNDAVSRLSVSGATKVGLVADGSKTDLRFAVEYNGNLPSTINWTFTVDNKDLVSSSSSFGGTLETSKGAVETVSFKDAVTTSNSNTNNIQNQFELVASFGSSVPTGATVGFESQNNLRVTFDELGRGNKTIKATVGTGSKYQGTYSAGIWVTQQPFTVEVRDLKSTSSTSVSFTVDANFLNTADIPKTTDGVIQYSQKTTSGDTTTWSDWKDASSKIEKNDVEEDPITKTVSGLEAGKTYKFRVIYNYNNGSTVEKVYSNETGEITLPTSSSNNTITGSGTTSTTTGTSTGSTSISVTTSNSTSSGTSVSVSLPSGFKYDSSKTPVAVTFKYKDDNGKVVTETKEQISNVTAKFNGNNIEVYGLVPDKNYDEITIDYTDNNGKTRSIILRNVKVTSTVEVEKYLANVYKTVFSRPADEAGYHFHLDNLKNKKVSLREFLLNMIKEKEFEEKYKTPEEKIEALYSVIVNRTSDEAGKKFWVDEYNKVLAVYGSQSTALQAIADRMVNENELKELADKMGVQW